MFGKNPKRSLLQSEAAAEAYFNPDNDVMDEKESVNNYFYDFGSDRAVAVKDLQKIYDNGSPSKG